MAATFKSLTKKEKQHLKSQEITTLREFKELAAYQYDYRRKNDSPGLPNPECCYECKAIARKLGLPV